MTINKFILVFALTALSVGAACSNSSNTNTAGNVNAPVNTNAANANTAEATPLPPPTVSPTESFIALSKASREKDVVAIKNRFSQATLVLFEQVAAEQGKTVDDILREPNGAPFPNLPDIGDEKIDGNSATLEIGDPETGNIAEIPFVNEGGEWKIAMDVYLKKAEDAIAAAENETKKP